MRFGAFLFALSTLLGFSFGCDENRPSYKAKLANMGSEPSGEVVIIHLNAGDFITEQGVDGELIKEMLASYQFASSPTQMVAIRMEIGCNGVQDCKALKAYCKKVNGTYTPDPTNGSATCTFEAGQGNW